MSTDNQSTQPKTGEPVASSKLLADVWKLEDDMGLRLNVRFHEILAAKAKALGLITAQLTAEQRVQAIEEWKSANTDYPPRENHRAELNQRLARVNHELSAMGSTVHQIKTLTAEREQLTKELNALTPSEPAPPSA